jgi:hypothetical protein
MSSVLVILVVVIVSGGWSAWWFGALGGVMVFLFWRYARTGIYVSGHGVRAARFFGSDVLPWGQLAAIEVSNSGEDTEMVLRAASGAVIHTEVYRGFTGRRNDHWLRPKTFDRLVARLRELHKQQQQDRQDSPP